MTKQISRIRLSFAALLLGVAAALCGTHRAEAGDAKTIAETLTVPERGFSRTFTVARDEIGRVSGGGSVETIAPQADAESVRKAARERAAAEGADLVLYEQGRPRSEATRRWLTSRVLARLKAGADAQAIAAGVGASAVERPAYAPDYAIFTAKAGAGNALELCDALRRDAAVESAEPLLARRHAKRFTPNDPFYAYNAANPAYQWYLNNTGQNGGTAGIGLNLTTVWDSWRGSGIRIGIVDDGVERTHADLAANVDLLNGYDWNQYDTDPSPGTDDNHGTACAGLAAARGNNGAGLSGAAPEATIVPLRLLGGPVTDAEEAAAFAWRNDLIHIKSNAWGPADDGATFGLPGPLAEAAMGDAVTNGRSGRGTIFIWAGGDGLATGDNANFDGYANSIFGIAVGAVNDLGKQASYSEPGANLLLCAPSDSTGRQGVLTTDRTGIPGYNNGTLPGNFTTGDYNAGTFGGTSAACSLAAGATALLLQSNPTLGWRDVKEILLRSATKNDATDADWVNNGAGYHFNHKYGAGLLNAQAAIALATGWTNLPAMTSQRKAQTGLTVSIPDAPVAGVARTFSFSADESLRVEEVTLEAGITHPNRGSVSITLTSPGGTVSKLSTGRANDIGANLYWRFSTVRHWGESAAGTWTVTVADTAADAITGTLNTLVLTLYGSNAAAAGVPVVTSAGSAGGNAGSFFSYQILASNGPTAFSASGLPAGLAVNTQTGVISGKPSVQGTFSVTLGAVNSHGTGTKTLTLTVGASLGVPLGNAVDLPSQTWDTDAANPWILQSTVTHDGVDAARSGAIGDNQSTAMKVQVSGPVVVRFWWKVSSENLADYLTFLENGSDFANISGEVGWQQLWYYIGPGSHRLEWIYSKDGGTVAGSDAGWVDQVEFLATSQAPPVFTRQPADTTVPAGGIAFLCTETVGAQPMTYQWFKNGVAVSGAASSSFAVNASATGDSGTYTCVATNALGTATSSAAVLTVLSTISALSTAVDNTTQLWTSVGDTMHPWVSQTSVTHDGVDAAKSGAITHGESSALITTVFGPGTVTFWWKVGSEQSHDYLDFYVDGTQYDYLTGNVDWRQATYSIPAGAHALQWVYAKDAAGTVSPDAGYVDQIVYTQKAYATWAAANFTLSQRVSDTITAPATDPNGDGVTNLLAYGFGISPTAGPGSPLPALAYNGTNYTLTYQKNTAATDVTFVVQRSQNFATWATVSTTDQVIATNGALQTIRATLPVTTGAPWFYRVQAGCSPSSPSSR